MALDVLDAPASEPFLERLQKEKLESQKRRGTLVQKKLVWVSGLSAIGAIQSVTLNLSESGDAVTAALSAESAASLLYLVPLIAVIFDLYIIGENFGVKRMGIFVRQNLPGTMDQAWEQYLEPRRDPFSLRALPLGSTIVLGVCALALWRLYRSWFLLWWILPCLVLIRAVYSWGCVELSLLQAGLTKVERKEWLLLVGWHTALRVGHVRSRIEQLEQSTNPNR